MIIIGTETEIKFLIQFIFDAILLPIKKSTIVQIKHANMNNPDIIWKVGVGLTKRPIIVIKIKPRITGIIAKEKAVNTSSDSESPPSILLKKLNLQGIIKFFLQKEEHHLGTII